MADLQAPARWSKDFVEHLRTVHFTLIASCVGLLILASYHKKTEIEIAHEQVSQILEVINTWKPDFLETAALETIKAKIPPSEQDQYLLTEGKPIIGKFNLSVLGYDQKKIYFQPKIESPGWILKSDVPAELQPDVSSGSAVDFRVNAPSNLKSFQRLWDALLTKGNIILPRLPSKCSDLYGWKDIEYEGDCEVEKKEISNASRPISLKLVVYTDAAGKTKYKFEGKATIQSFSPPTYEERLKIPSDYFTSLEFSGQHALIQRSAGWKEKDGRSFKDAFRELANVYEPFQDSTMAAAERILDAEAKRSADVFEAAGLKIPADVAVTFGVFLVLGIQLYLWIHLHEFGSRTQRDQGFEVAWIGVYFSKPARVIFLSSLLALPICTVLVLSMGLLRMSEYNWEGWAILIASNAASLTLSFFLLRVVPRQTDATLGESGPAKHL